MPEKHHSHYKPYAPVLQLKLIQKPRNSLVQQQGDEADRRALDEVEEDDIPPPLCERLRRREGQKRLVQGKVDIAVDHEAGRDLQYAARSQGEHDRRQPLFEAVDDGGHQHEAEGEQKVRHFAHADGLGVDERQQLFDGADDDRRHRPVHKPAQKDEHVGKIQLQEADGGEYGKF